MLKDPMRPADAVDPAPAAGTPKSSPPPSAGVQIILTSPERKLALIDGKLVPLKEGDRNALLEHPRIDKRPVPEGRSRE